MNCLRTNDKTIILGMVDIIDIWPSGRAYLASTTAEEVFIEFRGVRHSKTMILNLREALRGIVENNTVQTAVMKCVRTDTENDLIQELHEVNFSAEIEPSFDEIIQLLNEIETIPDGGILFIRSKNTIVRYKKQDILWIRRVRREAKRRGKGYGFSQIVSATVIPVDTHSP